MADVTTLKFGSGAWFLAWGERLANAGMTALTNTVTAKVTAAAPASSQSNSAGGFSALLGGLTWLPYAIVGAIVLIFVMVLRKK